MYKKTLPLTDEQLALAYAAGDNRAFDELLARHQSKLYAYILFVVRDRHVADDIFQETFVKIIVKLRQGCYVPTGKFGAWIMRIAHNVMMDLYRSQRTGREVPLPDVLFPGEDGQVLAGGEPMVNSTESKFVKEQVLRDAERIMNELPAPQREVVFMRYYQGLSFKEIAEITHVSVNTALGRMRYAILNMRKLARNHQVGLQFD